MKIEKIAAEFAEIVEQVTGVADVTCRTSFAHDLDVDSLSMAHLLVLAEDRFGMRIPDCRLTRMRTVGDVVRYIAGHQRRTRRAIRWQSWTVSSR